MLTVDRKQIALLHPVRIDRNLSKYDGYNSNERLMGGLDFNLNDSFMRHGDLEFKNMSLNVWDGVPFNVERHFRNKWKRAFAELYIKTRIFVSNLTQNNKLSEEDFFNSIKDSFKEIETLGDSDFLNIKEELELLYKAKQKYVFNKLKSSLSVSEYEKILKQSGFDKYQNEEDLISFILKAEAGISLIEIEYFQYEIPFDVKEKMFKADGLKVFDNFYILHKDKTFKPKEQVFTQEKKDPILFGVINGSTKLYYIADWITDYCDLTWDSLISNGLPNSIL